MWNVLCRLYVQWRFMRGIEAQFLALQKGFNELIPQHLLRPFDERELEVRIWSVTSYTDHVCVSIQCTSYIWHTVAICYWGSVIFYCSMHLFQHKRCKSVLKISIHRADTNLKMSIVLPQCSIDDLMIKFDLWCQCVFCSLIDWPVFGQQNSFVLLWILVFVSFVTCSWWLAGSARSTLTTGSGTHG